MVGGYPRKINTSKVIFLNQSRDGIVVGVKDDNILLIESDGVKFEVCKGKWNV